MKYIKISRYEKQRANKPVEDLAGNFVYPEYDNLIGFYYQEIDKIMDAINGEMDSENEPGTKIILEVVEMSEAEYNKLPEFQGY